MIFSIPFQYSESKSFCEDLTEGKFSFPIIHAVNNQTHDRQVLRKFHFHSLANYFVLTITHVLIADILRQRTKDVEVKKYCIHLLEKLGSFQYTRDILKQLDAEARAEVSVKRKILSIAILITIVVMLSG